jgi:hypothetical protein
LSWQTESSAGRGTAATSQRSTGDGTTPIKNPYVGKKKAVGINLSPAVIDYFKKLAEETSRTCCSRASPRRGRAGPGTRRRSHLDARDTTATRCTPVDRYTGTTA